MQKNDLYRIAEGRSSYALTERKSIRMSIFVFSLVGIFFSMFVLSAAHKDTIAVDAAKLGKEYSLPGNISLTPEYFRYSPTDEAVEAYIRIDDLYNAYRTKYDTTAAIRTDKRTAHLKVTQKLQSDEYFVIRVDGVPANLLAIRFDIAVQTKHPETVSEDQKIIKLYCTKESLEHVESLPQKEATGYLIDCITADIDQANNEAEELQSKIAANDEKRKECIDGITVLKQKMSDGVTSAETQEFTSAIKSLLDQAEKLEKDNQNLNQNIDTLLKKRKYLTAKLETLGSGD